MRAIIGAGAGLVVFALITAAQYGIISSHIRDTEVSRGISCAFDYCMDMQTDDEEEFIKAFCTILNDTMMTDGELDIYFLDAGIDDGFIDIVVEETYEYGFFGRTGKNHWEKAYRVYRE